MLYEVSVRLKDGSFKVYVVAALSEVDAEFEIINFLGSDDIEGLEGVTEIQPFVREVIK